MTRPARMFKVRNAALLRVMIYALLILKLSACVTAPEERPPPLDEGARQLQQGVAAYQRDEYLSASSRFARALYYYRGIDAREGMAHSHINLAETALAMGKPDTAEAHARAAAQLAEERALQTLVKRSQLLLGTLALRRGEYNEAQTVLDALLPDPNANPKSISALQWSALANRTRLALMRGDGDAGKWIDRLAQSIDGSPPEQGARTALAARYRAIHLHQTGQGDAADPWYAKALHEYKRLRKRTGIAATLEDWGESLMQRGQWDEAKARYKRALPVRIWILDSVGTARSLRGLQQVHRQQGRPDIAEDIGVWIEAVEAPAFDRWDALKQVMAPF